MNTLLPQLRHSLLPERYPADNEALTYLESSASDLASGSASGLPAGATGTYAIGLEARRTDTILAGTPKQQSVTYGAANPVTYFSVDGSKVTPRGSSRPATSTPAARARSATKSKR